MTLGCILKLDGPKWWLHNSELTRLGPTRKRWTSEKTEEQALQPWPGNYKEIAVAV